MKKVDGIEQQKSGSGKWLFALLLVIFLGFASYFIAGILSENIFEGSGGPGNVALIPIEGAIMPSKSGFFFSEAVTSSQDVIEKIRIADENPSVKAILFEINSPGGTPVASQEIAEKIKKSKKLTIAWIREAGVSGAYWVASSTDYIVASKISMVGSVGVIASYLEFSQTFNKYGVNYQKLTAGEYKDIGSPYRKMSADEESMMQEQLDYLQTIFLNDVVESRNLSYTQKQEISTGMFFVAGNAEHLHLVDLYGGKEEAVKYIEHKLNITSKIIEYKEKTTFFDILTGMTSKASYYMGEGIGSALLRANMANSLNIRI